jgi:hypothetical protein
VDFSVSKDFPLHLREGMRLQIRADMTNVFNHPSFANPNADVSRCTAAQGGCTVGALESGNVGTITGVVSGPRVIQLGAHFFF